jgi:hypothetical protein
MAHTARMQKLTVCLLAALLVLPVEAQVTLAASAAIKPSDIAATRAYLVAKHKFEAASARKFNTGEEAVQALVAHVSASCPNVLAGAPATKAVDSIREELLANVPLTLEHAAAPAAIKFANTVKRLHWSNRKLTYYAHGAAAEEKAQAEILLPDICADAKALAADGFQTTAPATTLLVKQYEAATSITTIVSKPGEKEDVDGLEGRIMKLLVPYEQPNEKSLIPKKLSAHQREKRELLGLELIFKPLDEIAHALALPAAPDQTPAAGMPPVSASV